LSDLTQKLHPEKIMSIVLNNGEFECKLADGCRLIHREGLHYRFLVNRSRVPEMAAKLYATGNIADLTIEDPPLEDLIGQLFTSGRQKPE
jgi:ABC-2 type transport system ATP-binding protein